ncbi:MULTISPECIES: hypothetical protein [unclassified Kaistella]|uniref:hypothetical protein n=1 Tax=unclassified Kaistella TaxID=2762626 RepID=UPI002734546F|nr:MULTISPECIES: hypothetical protein [unclassified Kaistella]MDP2455240.1 hypothetical protein [Kaistella sp. SH11-4b]MDP2458087.1 hypothetical protein [Kaistella sp. SH40-3]MDP2461054.1 hypothetical protein [Kaistella sp. SH19-2b]
MSFVLFVNKTTANRLLGDAVSITSLDFTDQIMSQILETKKAKIYRYKPPISKFVFAGIFITVMAFIIYFYINGNVKSENFTTSLDISRDYLVDFKPLFSFSKIIVYIAISAVGTLFLQILLLRRHFENQFKNF